MTNLYCPNCHRQLHEIDVKFKVCSMCCTPLKISEEKKDNTDCILDKNLDAYKKFENKCIPLQ